MDRDEVEVNEQTEANDSAILTERAWSVKDLLYMSDYNLFFREKLGKPERA